MRKLLLLSTLIPLIIAPSAFATSSASVEIHNNVNANSSSNSQVTSHTNVTVETNGNVTHYESDKPNENVQVQAVNGETTVKVNGSAITTFPSKEPVATITAKPMERVTPVISPETKFKQIFEQKLNFFKKFFSFLHLRQS